MPKTKPAAMKHIHRIVRLSGGRSYVYKCADPDCRYLIHHAQLYHLIGNLSRCFGCGNPFPLTESALQLELPMCDACANPEIEVLVNETDKHQSELEQYFSHMKSNERAH